jgi:hypothetical protein
MSSSIVRRGGWAGMAAALMYVLAGFLILTAPLQGVFSSLSEISLIMASPAEFPRTLLLGNRVNRDDTEPLTLARGQLFCHPPAVFR